ncbi:purine-nucleoside phosphorylase [Desulfobacterium sp. N47]|uniref:Purine nucleoside phosphorylase n=1 Tax=uncultured Desulfobacterium sp. TaxID=201089 RepID=E1YIK0_9BACT|nr:Purine nucleoside phosphorylase 1 [uncultured Desulfobacterium sp.]
MITSGKIAKKTAAFIRKNISNFPQIGILSGTGLGESMQSMDVSFSCRYEDIPNFPVSTVKSHIGKLLVGKFAKDEVMVLQGRFHLYEGYSPLEVTFPIRVMQELGIKILILTNAAGGLNTSFSAGDIMLITDHINLTGHNPLVGANDDKLGIRFPDMSAVYDKKLIDSALNAAKEEKVHLQKGVYAGLLGPSLETSAEVRFLKTIGADAVGFSTVQEVIAGVHAGMRILGLSAITNVHDPANPSPSTLDEIIDTAKKIMPNIDTIIKRVITDFNE